MSPEREKTGRSRVPGLWSNRVRAGNRIFSRSLLAIDMMEGWSIVSARAPIKRSDGFLRSAARNHLKNGTIIHMGKKAMVSASKRASSALGEAMTIYAYYFTVSA